MEPGAMTTKSDEIAFNSIEFEGSARHGAVKRSLGETETLSTPVSVTIPRDARFFARLR